MKALLFILLIFLAVGSSFSQKSEMIELIAPDTERGLPLMKALELRKTVRQSDTKELSLKDLSDLLWAANGINRPDEGKRTAASAMNAQDIDVYAMLESGIYRYNAQKHILELITSGDYRTEVAGRQEAFAIAPLILILVSDISKFSRGDETQRLMLGAYDAGIVAQNIELFCASENMASTIRAIMDKDKLREIMSLPESRHFMLNIPISYLVD